MGDRTDELLEDVQTDAGTDATPVSREEEAAAATADRGIAGRVRAGVGSRLQRVFSPRQFLLRTGVLAVGFVAGSLVPIPLLGWVGRALGMAAAGFGLGVATDERRYLETGVGGALIAGLAALLGNPLLAGVGLGGLLFAFWALLGAAAALVGAYLGRDLKDGLGRELD